MWFLNFLLYTLENGQQIPDFGNTFQKVSYFNWEIGFTTYCANPTVPLTKSSTFTLTFLSMWSLKLRNRFFLSEKLYLIFTSSLSPLFPLWLQLLSSKCPSSESCCCIKDVNLGDMLTVCRRRFQCRDEVQYITTCDLYFICRCV